MLKYAKFDLLQTWITLAAQKTELFFYPCNKSNLGFFQHGWRSHGHGFCNMTREIPTGNKELPSSPVDPYLYQFMSHATDIIHWSIELIMQKLSFADQLPNVWNPRCLDIIDWVCEERYDNYQSPYIFNTDFIKIFFIVLNPKTITIGFEKNHIETLCDIITALISKILWLADQRLIHCGHLFSDQYEADGLEESFNVMIEFGHVMDIIIRQMHVCFCFNPHNNEFSLNINQFQYICNVLRKKMIGKKLVKRFSSDGLFMKHAFHGMTIAKYIKKILFKRNEVRCNECHENISKIFS